MNGLIAMSYSVHIYRPEVRAKAKKHPEILEDLKQLTAFKKTDVSAIEAWLELVGFDEQKKSARGRKFKNKDLGAEALLTPTGLFLSSHGEDVIFEIGMLASELAAHKKLAKFDPQAGQWE